MSLFYSVSSFHSRQQSALLVGSSQLTELDQEQATDVEMEVCDSQQPMVSKLNCPKKSPGGLDDLLLHGRVLLISSEIPSLDLPKGFWEEEDVTKFMPLLYCQIEHDFDW